MHPAVIAAVAVIVFFWAPVMIWYLRTRRKLRQATEALLLVSQRPRL